jgi:hypothetical protein
MADDLAEVSGPVDYLLVEFPGDTIGGDTAAALGQMLDAGVVALWDLAVIRKGEDGTTTRIDLSAGPGFGGFGAYAGAQSGLLDDEDITKAGDTLQSGTTGLLLVYENSWSRPFVAAALDAGGQAVSSARIPAQTIMDALDAVDGES